MRTRVNVCIPPYGHFWLWVVTYPTMEEMLAAAQANGGGYEPNPDEQIFGMFSDNEKLTHYLGIMRLHDISTETIIHESVHAAICFAKKMHGWSKSFSLAKEEAVCYGAEAITTAVHKAIYPSEHEEVSDDSVHTAADR